MQRAITPTGKESTMDAPAPDAKRVIKMVPKYVLDQVTVEASIIASKKVSEGLLMAFENLQDDGNILTLSQKTEILSTVMFCMRDLDRDLDDTSKFGVTIHDSIYGQTTVDAAASSIEEFEEMFDFDPTDSDSEEQ
jgi:hypothetical protein